MEIYKMEQRSDLWYQIRTGRVTGTDFKTLLMKPTTLGYQGLVNRVTAEILTDQPDNLEKHYKTDIMENGEEMEPEAALEFEDSVLAGLPALMEVGFITPDPETPYYEWIGISPDRLIIDEKMEPISGLEIKCPLAKTHINYISEGKVPGEYYEQVQAALFVTGFSNWYFMSYYEGLKPFVIEVKPDLEVFEKFDQALTTFIHEVSAKLETYKKYKYLWQA